MIGLVSSSIYTFSSVEFFLLRVLRLNTENIVRHVYEALNASNLPISIQPIMEDYTSVRQLASSLFSKQLAESSGSGFSRVVMRCHHHADQRRVASSVQCSVLLLAARRDTFHHLSVQRDRFFLRETFRKPFVHAFRYLFSPLIISMPF